MIGTYFLPVGVSVSTSYTEITQRSFSSLNLLMTYIALKMFLVKFSQGQWLSWSGAWTQRCCFLNVVIVRCTELCDQNCYIYIRRRSYCNLRMHSALFPLLFRLVLNQKACWFFTLLFVRARLPGYCLQVGPTLFKLYSNGIAFISLY